MIMTRNPNQQQIHNIYDDVRVEAKFRYLRICNEVEQTMSA
jgi:hypothetical protein